MHGRAPVLVLAIAVIGCCGCSSVLRDPGGGSLTGHVSGPMGSPPDAAGEIRSREGPMTRWADRQRFIFERAWREIREDLAYDRIDSFANLEGPARRDVMAMRDDMASDRGTVATAKRRQAARRDTAVE